MSNAITRKFRKLTLFSGSRYFLGAARLTDITTGTGNKRTTLRKSREPPTLSELYGKVSTYVCGVEKFPKEPPTPPPPTSDYIYNHSS